MTKLKDTQPSSTSEDAHWLYVKCMSFPPDAPPREHNKAAFFLPDLNALKPNYIPKEEPTRTLRSLGIDEDVVRELKSKGEAHKVWVKAERGTNRLYQRPLQFFYTLKPLRHADMLRVK